MEVSNLLYFKNSEKFPLICEVFIEELYLSQAQTNRFSSIKFLSRTVLKICSIWIDLIEFV